MSEPNDDMTTANRVLIRIVAPLGSAVWAFAELVDGAIPAAELGLLVLTMGGLFAAFHYGIGELDRRLNSESRGVPSVDDL